MPREKRVMLMCAEGTEELEFMTVADILTRFGIKVCTCGIHSNHGVFGSCGIYLRPDYALEDLKHHSFDAIILPGGENAADAFAKSETLGDVLRDHYKRGALICAMCTAPLALKRHGIGYDHKLTSYPTLKDELKKCYEYRNWEVVMDDNLITSRGPGTATEFTMKIGETLTDKATAKSVSSSMLL